MGWLDGKITHYFDETSTPPKKKDYTEIFCAKMSVSYCF